MATATWWKEERPPGAVFVDYNQNAKDHTVAAGLLDPPGARRARRLRTSRWDEVPDCELGDFRIDTVPGAAAHGRRPERDDRRAPPGSLDSLLALADEQEPQDA